MYASLILPWSTPPTPDEQQYRLAGLVKTKGTIFILPPPESVLRAAYNAPPRARSMMSAGAVALCKHFERGGSSADPSKGRELHPFWALPVGSNDRKTAIAAQVLDEMMKEAVWRNVIWLHEGVAVYETRNARGYGMRWTLRVVEGERGTSDEDGTGRDWRILETAFRGFLEPIEGLDHELERAQAPK